MGSDRTKIGQAQIEAIEWKHGWPTVLSAAIGYGAGPVLFLTSASVFIRPTMEATGWSTTEVLISPFIGFLLSVLGPLAGRLADRTSPRKTVAVGLVVYGALLATFALVPFNRLTYYGLGAAIGIAGTFAYMVPINRAVAAWFFQSSGKAFGMVGVGGASMPLLGIPVITYVIYTWGFQRGYLALAGFALLIALPSILIGLRSRPLDAVYEHEAVSAARELVPDTTFAMIMRSPRFWVLFASVAVATCATAGFLANMQPLLLDGGLSVVAATSITTLSMIGILLGRIGTGALLDAFNRYRVTAAVLTCSGIAGLVLSQTSVMPYAIVLVTALTVSFSQGADADAFSVISLRDYGRRNFSLLFSACYVATGVGALAGPYLFGSVRDASGDYGVAAGVGGVLYIAAAVLTLIFGVLAVRERAARGVTDDDAAVEPHEPAAAPAR